MTFIKDNFELIVLIAFIFTWFIVIYSISIQLFTKKFFSSGKYKLNALVKYDNEKNNTLFSIYLYNNNFNDVRIMSLGFIYKNHNIDYYQSYLDQNNLNDNQQVKVDSRDFILLDVSVNELKETIKNLNGKNKKVSTIETYMIDALGIQSKIKSKVIQKYLKIELKKDLIKAEIEKKAELKKISDEQKEIKKLKRKQIKALRKEKTRRLLLKLKSKFNRK